jgi:hypothetical protein
MGVALGAVTAVAASVLFSLGFVLQAVEARELPDEDALSLALLIRLVRRPRWVIGLVLSLVGFALHVSALRLAPLAVVQPALTGGLVVLLVAGSRATHQPVRARDVVAVVAISIGVIVAAITASPVSTHSASPLQLCIALLPLAAVALLPYLLRRRGQTSQTRLSLVAALGAGAAYSFTGLTTKLVSDRFAAGDLVGTLWWLLVTASMGWTALLDQTSALQQLDAKRVGVIVYVAPVVIPTVLSALILGGRWASSPANGVALGVALVIVCAGAGALASSEAVAKAESGGP